MLNPEVKAQIQKAKKFAKEHTTLVACAVTAVVVSKYTYNITTEHCVKQVASYVEASEDTKLKLTAACTLAFGYITEKGQMDEFFEFAERRP